jgi:hypothetical protein
MAMTDGESYRKVIDVRGNDVFVEQYRRKRQSTVRMTLGKWVSWANGARLIHGN